jgi:hypothetical protein
VEGLEPPSLAALDPKSSVSTNFTTPAQLKRSAKVRYNIENCSGCFIFFVISTIEISWECRIELRFFILGRRSKWVLLPFFLYKTKEEFNYELFRRAYFDSG